MKQFGIKRPPNLYDDETYITNITYTEHESWRIFFSETAHRNSMDTAIRAYQAIGYECVRLEVKEISPDKE